MLRFASSPASKTARHWIGGGQLVGNAKVVAPERIVRLVTVRQPGQNLLGAAETVQSRRNPSQVRFRHVALHFADPFVAQRHLAQGRDSARLARKVFEVLQRSPYQQVARRGRPRHARDGVVQFEEHGVGQAAHLIEAALGPPRLPPGGAGKGQNQHQRQGAHWNRHAMPPEVLPAR